jgi:hypothetical protein
MTDSSPHSDHFQGTIVDDNPNVPKRQSTGSAALHSSSRDTTRSLTHVSAVEIRSNSLPWERDIGTRQEKDVSLGFLARPFRVMARISIVKTEINALPFLVSGYSGYLRDGLLSLVRTWARSTLDTCHAIPPRTYEMRRYLESG